MNTNEPTLESIQDYNSKTETIQHKKEINKILLTIFIVMLLVTSLKILNNILI